MNGIRDLVAAGVIIAAMASCGGAFAQAPASPPVTIPAPAPASSQPSVATRVETWTRMQWDAAQKEWAKDKAKWADCRNQSKAKNLSERNSWSFLYRCMTD